MASRIYTPEDLRAWRARARLSQADVASLFAVAQRTVSMWEHGRMPEDFHDRFERVLVDYYAKRPELLRSA